MVVFITNHRNLRKYNKTLVVAVGVLSKVVGAVFETWVIYYGGGRGGGLGPSVAKMEDKDT